MKIQIRYSHNRIQLQLYHGSHLPAKLVAWERQNVESTGSAAILLKQHAQSRVVRVLHANAVHIHCADADAVRISPLLHGSSVQDCKFHETCVDYLQGSGARNIYDNECPPLELAERHRLAVLQRRKVVDALGRERSACSQPTQ